MVDFWSISTTGTVGFDLYVDHLECEGPQTECNVRKN